MSSSAFEVKDLYAIAKPHFHWPDTTVSRGTTSGIALDELTEDNAELVNSKLISNFYGYPRNQFHAVKWVMMTSKLTKNARLVEITVASYYSSSKGYAYPTQQTIADITGLSLHSVSKAIQEMKESDHWLIKRTMLKSRSRSSLCYYLLPPFGYGMAFDVLVNKQGGETELRSALNKAGYQIQSRIGTESASERTNFSLNLSHRKSVQEMKDRGFYKKLPSVLEFQSKEARKIWFTILGRVK